MAPLIIELLKFKKEFKTTVCVTGQHRELLDQVLKVFNIIPDFNLKIMRENQDLYDITTQVLLGMKNVLKKTKPDLVLVHGDTSTSIFTALAAFYEQIPVGHVEAGLRTYNKYSPWPEEMNRQLTTRLATFHFTPTPLSKQNLLSEGIQVENIYITGNTVIDALHIVLDKIKKDITLQERIRKELYKYGLPSIKFGAWEESLNTIVKDENKLNKPGLSQKTFSTDKRRMVLITGHRRENFGEGFDNICKAIQELSEIYSNVDFVYPVHLNPNVRNSIKKEFGPAIFDKMPLEKIENSQTNPSLTNIYFIEPLDYLPFIYLMNLSYLILTDSGGIQEEAPSLGKPVLVMRDTTERPEAVDAGTVSLVGTNKETIVKKVSILLDNNDEYSVMSTANNPYGDGEASKRIVEILMLENF